ncbi:RNA-dependent RNA polymerase family protein [Bacillus aquiflavi]|uniref:hypothetical protein n=1 Tax=Bacillus aquiflavi TaxID=2672567 RepID=UPI00223A9450|nr:hypothetical protein [Bacillus aquiflavi]
MGNVKTLPLEHRKDDSIIFVKSEKAANRVMKSITNFIEKKLGLIVNAEKSRISRPGNTKFLGFGFYYDTHTKNINHERIKIRYGNSKES